MLECLFIKYDFHQDFKRMHLLCKVQLMYQCPKKKIIIICCRPRFCVVKLHFTEKICCTIFSCAVYSFIILYDWIDDQ